MKSYQCPIVRILKILDADVLTASPAEFQEVNINELISKI